METQALQTAGEMMGSAWIATLVPVVMAIIDAFRKAFPAFNSRYVPLASLSLGIVAGLVFADGEVVSRVLNGLMIGLSATGLKSGGKSVVKGSK